MTDPEENVPPRPVELETVTMEAFFEAMKALKHLQRISDLEGDVRLRRALRLTLRTLTLERIICAMDKAADNPDWWKANRLHIYCPEMTLSDIAKFLKIRKVSVKYYIKAVEIPADAYEALPPVEPY